MHTRKQRMATALMLLACGIFVSATVDRGTEGSPISHGDTSVRTGVEFTVVHRPGRLVLEGTAVSAAHERDLLRIASEQFGVETPIARFRPGVLLPADWKAKTTRLLYALAATESASAIATGDRIVIRGVTADRAELSTRIAFLREVTHPDTPVDQDFIEVNTEISLADLCRRNLRHAASEAVEFAESSAEIRSSAKVVLDKVVEVLTDCRDSQLAVTGHTDASGSEVWNRRLSLARARTAADYLVRHGIEAQRLRIEGLGSDAPVADDSTALGRSLNRRIEFEFVAPSL